MARTIDLDPPISHVVSDGWASFAETIRPTIGGTEALLEAHVFDFSADLYGREIEVEFAAKIRDEECFATLEALTAQMHRDAEAARRILQ